MSFIFFLLFIFSSWNNLLLNGVASLEAEGIIGGDTDWSHNYKYQVSIQKKKKNTGQYQHGCGGSIIHEKYILTAAHCFINRLTNEMLDPTNGNMRVLAGTNRLDSGGIERYIENVFIPKGYKYVKPYLYGDIAVVKLVNKLDLANHKKLATIKLPKKHNPNSYSNKNAVTSGFGISTYDIVNGIVVPRLTVTNNRQYLTIKMQSKEECPPFEEIICTISEKKNAPNGICEGDSGGPLVYDGILLGVVSRASKDCDMRTKTGKFTRVSYYLDFINRSMQGNSNKSDMIIL